MSTHDHAEVLEKYLKGEKEAGRVLSPLDSYELTPEAHISIIGIIPKRHQENIWRLIIDRSSQEGCSVNDGISPTLSSLEYIHIQLGNRLPWTECKHGKN